MAPTRRKFTLEFRIEAAHRVIDSGRSVTEVAREILMAENSLFRWVRDRTPTHGSVQRTGARSSGPKYGDQANWTTNRGPRSTANDEAHEHLHHSLGLNLARDFNIDPTERTNRFG